MTATGAGLRQGRQGETEHVPVAIVGAGFAGLGAGIRLAERGIGYTILERADDVGGTWRANSYPGCQCDVPSHLYSFSFALNPDWTRTYSPQPEIWEYLRGCAERFGVMPNIRFGHEVTDARWDDADRRWRIRTPAGDLTADFLILGNGALSEPSVPDIEGLGSFRGAAFHSAAWDHGHDLRGERVAVIGTGASAIQFVPRIQPEVGHMTVFQRTAPWVLPHTDRPVRDVERRVYRRIPALQRLVRSAIYWARELMVFGLAKNPRLLRGVERLGRRHLEQSVADPQLRAVLSPHFSPGCKRLLLSNDWYPALTAPNVTVVTERIAAVTPTGVLTADGVEHPVDTIIFGTGFRVTDNPVAGMIRGRDGRSLAESWAETGMQAYLGTTVHGFPNLFMLAGPNTGIGHTSLVYMIEAQIDLVLQALSAAERRGATVEPRLEVQAAYNRDVQRRMQRTVWMLGGCASWYLDSGGRNPTLWPDFTWKFRRMARRFDPARYHFEPLPAPQDEPVLQPAGAGRSAG